LKIREIHDSGHEVGYSNERSMEVKDCGITCSNRSGRIRIPAA